MTLLQNKACSKKSKYCCFFHQDLGFYSFLAVITILCGGIIFLTLVWYPFVVRYSRSHLQIVVDEVCRIIGQESIPLNPEGNYQVTEELTTVFRALEPLGELEIFLVAIQTAFDRQPTLGFNSQIDWQTDGVFYSVNLQNQNLLVDQVLINQLNPGDVLANFQGIDEFLHSGSTLFCIARLTIDELVFIVPGALGVTNPTLLAVSAVTRQLRGDNSWDLNPLTAPNVTIVLVENPNLSLQAPGGFNPIVAARNMFASSLAHLLARNGFLRRNLQVVRVIQAPQSPFTGEQLLLLNEDPFSLTWNTPACNFQQDQQFNELFTQSLNWNRFLSSQQLILPTPCQQQQQQVPFFSILPTINPANLISGGAGNLPDADVIILIGFQLPQRALIEDVVDSGVTHVVVFSPNVINFGNLGVFMQDVNLTQLQGFGCPDPNVPQNCPNFNLTAQGLIQNTRQTRFTLTIFDPCSIYSAQPENNFWPYDSIQEGSNQAACRRNTIPVPANYWNAFIANIGSDETRQDLAFNQNPPLQVVFDNIFSSNLQNIIFPYAFEFYRSLLTVLGWTY
ncbi:MAG: hypothetical protein NZO16_01150 [Deltaproteobacteria bacterium]|nr:hypothetical protein [Deltaproteobacteria bacterium]